METQSAFVPSLPYSVALVTAIVSDCPADLRHPIASLYALSIRWIISITIWRETESASGRTCSSVSSRVW